MKIKISDILRAVNNLEKTRDSYRFHAYPDDYNQKLYSSSNDQVTMMVCEVSLDWDGDFILTIPTECE